MPDGRAYDGHSVIFGQNTADNPAALPREMAAKAVNRIFRGGRNRTRPPFLHDPFVFEESAIPYEGIFRFGNFQGWARYEKKSPGRRNGIVVSVSGYIFFIFLVNEKFHVKFVFGQNDPMLMHTWFEQGEEWIYIQNGKDLPVMWNGLNVARRSDPEANEMPVGTIMRYCFGRMFVSNSYNQIVASDIIYGNGLSKTDATHLFTENTYWAEGGYFNIPSSLGPITGMIVATRQDYKNSSQGELVITSERGASAIEASLPRLKWKDSQIQTVTMTGRGNVSPHSLINVNNDIWMRSNDGISSYAYSRSDLKQKLSFGKFSRHVNYWLDQDTPWLRQFTSMIYFDNRIIATVAPEIEDGWSTETGDHRYHKGMVVLDIEEESSVQGDSSFNWDGLWTGIRPCALITLDGKAFAWSRDEDKTNRVYEIARFGLNDRIESTSIRPKWFYITKKFDWSEGINANIKTLAGGFVNISDIRDEVEVLVNYRPDHSPVWNEIPMRSESGSDFGNEWKFSHPRYDKLVFLSPVVDSCGLLRPSNKGESFQFMVSGSGCVEVDKLVVGVDVGATGNPLSGDCKPNDSSKSISGRVENDFEYSILLEASS